MSEKQKPCLPILSVLQHNVKRFKIETNTLISKFLFIKEGKVTGSWMLPQRLNPRLKCKVVADPKMEMLNEINFKFYRYGVEIL